MHRHLAHLFRHVYFHGEGVIRMAARLWRWKVTSDIANAVSSTSRTCHTYFVRRGDCRLYRRLVSRLMLSLKIVLAFSAAHEKTRSSRRVRSASSTL